jgi:hypothetical protein
VIGFREEVASVAKRYEEQAMAQKRVAAAPAKSTEPVGKALTTNRTLKAQPKARARVRRRAVSRRSAKETPPQPKKRKTYPTLNAIIATRRGIMQPHVPNPIRGRKARISSPRSQKKIEPNLHCQCSVGRGIETGKRDGFTGVITVS